MQRYYNNSLKEAGRMMTDLNNVLFLCQEPFVVDGGPLRVGVGDGRVEVIGEATKIWHEKNSS